MLKPQGCMLGKFGIVKGKRDRVCEGQEGSEEHFLFGGGGGG